MIIKGNQESELLEAEPAAKFLGGWRYCTMLCDLVLLLDSANNELVNNRW